MGKAVNKRNYGIDLLRIVSMILVVVLHVCGQGGILEQLEPGSFKYIAVWVLETVGFCSVNCYALISGYVGYKSKFKYANVFELYLTVVFYMLIITTLFKLQMPTEVNFYQFVKAVFPFINGGTEYWYFTAYLCAFFFFPYLKKLVEILNKRALFVMLCVMAMFFSVIPTFVGVDVFVTRFGYAPLWLMVLYVVGAYMKKYESEKRCASYKLVLLFILCIGVVAGVKMFFEFNTEFYINGSKAGSYFITYTSPGIVIASVVLVKLFANMKTGKLFSKMIAFVAPLSFSVYIIHCNPLVWEILWKGRFENYANLKTIFLIPAVILTAVAVWFVCSCADILRSYIFKLLKVKKLLIKAEEKAKNILNKYIAEE